MKKKILVGLMVLVMAFVGTTALITNADESEMRSAEALVRIPDANLPKIAIITSDIGEYGNLKAVQTNTKTKLYLYKYMEPADIIEIVRDDEPQVIYLMGDANKIDENIRIVFNILTPTIRMSQVRLEDWAYDLAGMTTPTPEPKVKDNASAKIEKTNYGTIKEQNNEKAFVGAVVREEYVNGFNSGKYFDHDKFISAFEKLLNEERARKGLKPLEYSKALQEGSDIRANEQAELGSQESNGKAHTRPDGSSCDTAFRGIDIYRGECTAELLGPRSTQDVTNYEMKVYKAGKMLMRNEEDVAQALFITWCNSPGHYRAMMREKANYFSVSARMVQSYAKEALYNDMNAIIGIFALGR